MFVALERVVTRSGYAVSREVRAVRFWLPLSSEVRLAEPVELSLWACTAAAAKAVVRVCLSCIVDDLSLKLDVLRGQNMTQWLEEDGENEDGSEGEEGL